MPQWGFEQVNRTWFGDMTKTCMEFWLIQGSVVHRQLRKLWLKHRPQLARKACKKKSHRHLQTVQVRWRHLNKAFVCCTWKYIASSWGSSAKWCPPRSHRWPSYLLRRLSSGVPLSEPSRMIATSKGCGWLPGQLPHPDILTSSIQHNVWGKLWKGQRRHNHCSCCAPCLVWCCDDATTCVPVGQGIETVSERFNIMFQLSLAFLLANLEGNQEKLLAHPWWWGLATLQQVTAGQDLAFRKHLHTTAAFSCRKCFMGRVCRVASKHPPQVQN